MRHIMSVDFTSEQGKTSVQIWRTDKKASVTFFNEYDITSVLRGERLFHALPIKGNFVFVHPEPKSLAITVLIEEHIRK